MPKFPWDLLIRPHTVLAYLWPAVRKSPSRVYFLGFLLCSCKHGILCGIKAFGCWGSKCPLGMFKQRIFEKLFTSTISATGVLKVKVLQLHDRRRGKRDFPSRLSRFKCFFCQNGVLILILRIQTSLSPLQSRLRVSLFWILKILTNFFFCDFRFPFVFSASVQERRAVHHVTGRILLQVSAKFTFFFFEVLVLVILRVLPAPIPTKSNFSNRAPSFSYKLCSEMWFD